MTARWLLAALTFAACATSSDRSAAGPADTAVSWARQMRTVKATLARMQQSLAGSPQGDLVAVAHDARAAAAILRQAYTTAENPSVPGYARFAREAESWLLQVALEARSAHGELAAESFAAGVRQHCTACHDAVERAGRAGR